MMASVARASGPVVQPYGQFDNNSNSIPFSSLYKNGSLTKGGFENTSP